MSVTYFSADAISINEGGKVFTFFWNRKLRIVRVWFKPDFWRPSAHALFERCWFY